MLHWLPLHSRVLSAERRHVLSNQMHAFTPLTRIYSLHSSKHGQVSYVPYSHHSSQPFEEAPKPLPGKVPLKKLLKVLTKNGALRKVLEKVIWALIASTGGVAPPPLFGTPFWAGAFRKKKKTFFSARFPMRASVLLYHAATSDCHANSRGIKAKVKVISFVICLSGEFNW